MNGDCSEPLNNPFSSICGVFLRRDASRSELTTMARITVEDCLLNVENRFQLVHLTSKRVRQIEKGARKLVHADNKNVVMALREIAANKVRPQTHEAKIEE